MDKDDILRLLGDGARRFLPEGRELRTNRDTSIRAGESEAPTARGHAAVYDQWTNIGGWFLERIAPGTFDKTMQEADVRMLFNHNPDTVLARTKNGTLTLSTDETGLVYDGEFNREDSEAMNVHAKIARGDVDQSSFAFRVVKEEWEEASNSGDDDLPDLPRRTITEAQLFDVSPVTYPAYEGTDVGARTAANMALAELSTTLGLSSETRDALFSKMSDATAEELVVILEDVAGALRNDENSETPDGEVEDEATDDTRDDEVTDVDESASEDAGEPAAEEAPVEQEEDDESERERWDAEQRHALRKLKHRKFASTHKE